MTRKQTFFFAEITDIFGGDANYSWVTRHKIKASSVRGALIKLNRDSGLGFRINWGDRYDSRSGLTCVFITEWDDDYHSNKMNVTENLA
jgi:hypothetical protein